MSDRKHKILIIYDVAKQTSTGETIGWAYYNRATSLQQFCPPDFDVDICAHDKIPWEKLSQYSLVYSLEYAAPERDKHNRFAKHVPLGVSYNSDSRRRHAFWPMVKRQADFVVFNNVEAYEYYADKKRDKAVCISNGVNTSIWRPTVPINDRPQRALWCGSSGITKGKGWDSVFQPLEKMLSQHGFESDFRPIDDINEKVVYPQAKQVEWYNSGSYILCASLSEGTPGISLEGSACGCVLVTVEVGNVQEFGRDRENCVLVQDRTPEAFLEALKYAREHRERLSAAGLKTMQEGWSYGAPGNRADYFFALFRRIINDGVESVKPFRYDEIKPEEI